MAAKNYKDNTIPQLKAFLSDRGINTSFYRKDSLVKLCEAASEINLQPLEEEDYHTSANNRRTIEVDGKPVMFPDIMSINEWNRDLTALPNIEMGDIMVYFMTSCMWASERLKSYKSDNGYQLFLKRHIDNVVIHLLPNGHVYVKCSCVPETRQNERPYCTWVLMDSTANVKSGGCTCVADDGTCKHCVALLFSVQSFSERHRDRGIEVCTDKACTWDKPRKTSHPVVVQDLSYRSNSNNADSKNNFIPVSEQFHQVNNSEIKKSLYKACKSFGSVLLHTMDPPSDISDNDEDQDNETPSLVDIINNFKHGKDSFENAELTEHLKSIHSKDIIDEIENMTKDQSESDMWHKYRKGRITASVMGSVLKCRMDKLDNNNYIKKRINGEANLLFTAATEYGKTMESVALQQYSAKYFKTHKKAQINKSGLTISDKFPFIAASPDSFVSCKCCGEGLVEIKCSFTHQHKYVAEIANENNYHISELDGEIKLKKSSSWYAQVQTQLYCTGRPWCDFVVFTRKDMAIDRISYDEQYFSECLTKACRFFFEFLI